MTAEILQTLSFCWWGVVVVVFELWFWQNLTVLNQNGAQKSVHIFKSNALALISCLMSSWNKTLCCSFLAKGDQMQQVLHFTTCTVFSWTFPNKLLTSFIFFQCAFIICLVRCDELKKWHCHSVCPSIRLYPFLYPFFSYNFLEVQSFNGGSRKFKACLKFLRVFQGSFMEI